MAKEKRKLIRKIIDFGAKIIFVHDDLQIKADAALVKAKHKIVDGLAAVISGHDLAQAYIDRGTYILHYKVAHLIHRRRDDILKYKKHILGYFAGCILVAIGVVAMFNYVTAYEYSYNGKALGYVKNQEEVLKILDVVSTELSKEYGANVEIDPDSDISFKRVVSIDKEIDNIDSVLRKFTYMSDMQSEGFAIYIDGVRTVILKSKGEAQGVLDTITADYTEKKNKTIYEEVSFVEDVEIKSVSVKLKDISNSENAVKLIKSGKEEEVTYTVKAGDTYYGICEKFGITLDELKEKNPSIKGDELFAGQELLMSEAVSLVSVQTVETSTFSEVVKFKTKYKKSDSMYKGDSQVNQEGKNGKRAVTARITRVNGKEVDRQELSSEVITEPVTEIITKGTKTRPKTAPTGTFTNPIKSGYTLSSTYGYRWGRMHQGIDMACGTGTPIYAADGGTVVQAGWYSGYGLFIEINHGDGRVTRYGHCNSVAVSAGEKVYQGQKIGEVGNTGRSTGSHLHFEILINGSTVNPLSYI